MSIVNTEIWQFLIEWYDHIPQLKKQFLLKYYHENHQIEMIDLKNKKIFLKKCPCPPEITISDFFLGSKIVVYSRELEIIDYADEITRSHLQQQLQPSLAILTARATSSWGRFLDRLQTNKLQIKALRTIFFSDSTADEVCAILKVNHRKRNDLIEGPCLLVSIHGEDGIRELESFCSDFIQDLSSRDALILAPSSGVQVNALFDLLNNSAYGKADTATLDSCTCCIIKPHAVKSGLVGKILECILSQGYEISAIQTLQFDRAGAEEFLEVYNGVIPTFSDHVVQLVSGPSIALEIRAVDPVTTFRVTAGPWDVDMAKELRPGTIRALFGVDNIRNAIHCTDLPIDGVTECEYCFKLMEKKLI